MKQHLWKSITKSPLHPASVPNLLQSALPPFFFFFLFLFPSCSLSFKKICFIISGIKTISCTHCFILLHYWIILPINHWMLFIGHHWNNFPFLCPGPLFFLLYRFTEQSSISALQKSPGGSKRAPKRHFLCMPWCLLPLGNI